MSYHIQRNNRTNEKYPINFKQRRKIYSINEDHSQNSFSTKHFQSCVKTTNRNRVTQNKKSRWTTRTLTRNNNSMFSTCHHSSITNEIQSSLSKSDLNDDTKSESSIEYDYEHPLPTFINPRRVSIATIYLQDKQWQQLELFIKHFSSCVSLSNNLNINSSTTHLLIDDSLIPFQCILSKKIFQAVARHIFIVSIRWIEECLIQNDIIDENPFEIHGDGTITTMHLARISPYRLVFSSSIAFIIDCNSFQRVFNRSELMELVILTGAKLFDSQQRNLTKILLILVEPSADRSELIDKYKDYHKNIQFLTPGFLLKSIIYQKQQPFEDFEL